MTTLNNLVLLITLTISSFRSVSCVNDKNDLLHVVDYYWRDYTGVVPSDALVGGKDINDRNIYIGQAFVKDHGLIVVQINAGDKEFYAPIHGVKTVDYGIKILCTQSPESFGWMKTNGSDIHLQLLNKHPVIGGFEGEKTIHVGRISYQGSTRIGKICSFNVGDAWFRFPDKNVEMWTTSYEVLLDLDSPISQIV